MPQAFWIAAAKVAAKVAVDIAVAVAVNYAINALFGKGGKRVQGWSPIKQPVPARHYAYGHGRKPGVFLLYESVPKRTLDVLAFCDGRCGGNITHFFHDDIITLKPGGGGETNQTDGHYGGPVYLSVNDGNPVEPAHTIITAYAGSLWTANHRANGTVTAGLMCLMVSDEKMKNIYPNGEIEYSMARDWLCVYDWRKDDTAGGVGPQRRENPATWAYSANPVVCWVHDEWHVQGRDWDRRFQPNLADLTEEANACDDLIPQASGPPKPRYEAFVWYEADNERKEALDAWVRSCDGWMSELGDGSLLFRVGRWLEPEDVITRDMVVEYSWTGGVPKSRLVNEIQPRFTVPGLLYEVADTQAIKNGASIAARGRKPLVFAVPESVNNSQTMRLAKIKMDEISATYNGRFVFDLDRLPRSIFKRRFHRLQIAGGPTSLTDVYVEFVRPVIDTIERTLTAQVRSVTPSRYNWNVVEEGAGPTIEEGASGYVPLPPVILSAVAFESTVGTATGTRLRVTFDEPEDSEVKYAVRWRIPGDDVYTSSGFQEPSLDLASPYVETGFVPAEALEIQVSAQRTSGTSDWAPEPPLAIDATLPDVRVTSSGARRVTSSGARRIVS